MYKVELAGDGKAAYHGEGFVLVEGDHSAVLAPADVICLVDAFRAADFWSLSPRYVAPVTDQSTYTLTLAIGGKAKTVEDYVGQAVGMPKAVNGLEDAVDQVSGDARWIWGDATTLPALQAEHFDFRGRAGADLLARAVLFDIESENIEDTGAARARRESADQIVLGLIARGAPLDGHGTRYESSATAAEFAAFGGRLDLLRALIKAGAFETGGRAAVSAALRASMGSSRKDVVEEVLKYHPDVNSQDERGDTALHLILSGGHAHVRDGGAPNEDREIIAILVQAGADPNIPNHEGKTVLHDVMDAGLARAFIAGGAKLEVRDNDGNTPLLATFDEETAVVLVEAGADPMAKTSAGKTFVQLARSKGWKRALAAVRSRRKG
jgi:hypothetical protein